MPYSPTTWTAGVTPVSAPNQNHLETQYTEATNSLGVDEAVEGYVGSGLTVTKTGAAQITLASGTAWVLQTDGTLRRYAVASTPETTVTINTTYFLDLKPDGTLNWATSHSGVNYVTLASVTTDGSGNVLAITDTRPTLFRWLGNASLISLVLPGKVTANVGGALAAPVVTGMSASAVAGAGMGTGAYKYVCTFAFDGGETLPSAAVNVTTTGGNNQVSLTGIPVSADPRVTRRKIYRTAVGGSTYSWVKTIGDNSTTTYTDAASDAAIASTVKVPPSRSTLGGNLRSGYPWGTSTPNTTNQGTVTGTTFGQTSMVTGDSATAALFNGTSDKITFPVAGLPSGNSPWTIIAVVKPTNATNAGNGQIVAFGDVGVSGGLASIAQAAAGGWITTTNGGDTSPAGTSVAGTKHFLAGKWDGTTLTCWLDAASIATATPGIRALTLTAGRIGDVVNDTQFFPGTVQKAAIFPYALSAQQLSLYNTLMGGASGNLTFDQQVVDDGAIRYYTLGDPVSSTTAAETSRYETSIAQDGTVTAANLVAKQIAGQVTAGSFGLPVIVAQAINTHVTATTQQTVLSFTPPIDGLYQCFGSFVYSNGSATHLWFYSTYTDPITAGGPQALMHNETGSIFNLSVGATGGTTSPCWSPAFYAKGGAAISVIYQDNAGTPGDWVTAVLCRLS